MNMFCYVLFASIFYIQPLKNFILRRYLSSKREQYFSITNIDDNDGYDHRYSLDETVNKTQINNFSENLKKIYLLQLLTDNRVSTLTKINILNEYTYEYNLTAGGLLDKL